MGSLVKKTYQLNADVDLVPDNKGGIYYFKLRFPNNYELGLSGDSISEAQKTNLLNHLNRFKKILIDQKYTGILVDNKKGLHLRGGYQMEAIYRDFVEANELFYDVLNIDLSDDLLHHMIDFIRDMFNSLPPIYIGMAVEQSLQSRLKQHIAGETGLLSRISKYQFSVSDLSYHCLPLPENYDRNHRDIEKLLQNLFKPKFSLD